VLLGKVIQRVLLLLASGHKTDAFRFGRIDQTVARERIE